MKWFSIDIGRVFCDVFSTQENQIETKTLFLSFVFIKPSLVFCQIVQDENLSNKKQISNL